MIALIISAAQLLIGTLHIGSPETKLVFTDVDHHPFYGSNLLTDPNCHTHCKGWTLRFRVVNESRHPVYVEDVDVAYAVNGQPPSGGERLYSAGGPISFVRPGMLPRRLRLDQHGGYSFESRVTGPDLCAVLQRAAGDNVGPGLRRALGRLLHACGVQLI